MPELENVQHELFANEYIVDFNATKAAERAGYRGDYGRALITQNQTVKDRISELRDELTAATEITAERIARAYAEIAFMDGRDIARVLDALGADEGALSERLDDLPRSITAPIKKLSRRVDNKGTTYTVEAYDRHRALDVLRERFWQNDEADDEFVTAIEGMRDSGVPDLSEESNLQHTYNTDNEGDTHNTDSTPDATGWQGRITGGEWVAPDDDSDAPTWRENKPRR
jgi:phage terminase small subunit